MTSPELETLLSLLAGARHIVIGTDFTSRTDADRIAAVWGGLVLATVTWPETAASWLRQARRFAAPEPDAWVVSATPASWAGMARRLQLSTAWSPHRTFATSALAGYPIPGLRGAHADGTTWET